MTTIFNWLNKAERDHGRKSFKGRKSLTVPDQSFTIREIIHRFTLGRPINGTASPAIFDDAEGQLGLDVQQLDLADRMAMYKQAKYAAKQAEKKRLQDSMEAEQKRLREQIIAEHEASKNSPPDGE